MEKYKILVMDDSQASLDLIKDILDDDDLVIATARSGSSALKKARANPFDLILLDIIMPDIDGFDVLKELRKHRLTKDVPVIFITAKNDEENTIRGFEAGAMDYVAKPFNDAELKARIRNHLELKRSKEKLIKAKEEAERNSRFKSEFLANMSHEIRTPISGILGVVDLLKGTRLDNEQEDFLNIIESSTDLLLTIINDILDLSKIEAGKMLLEALPFEVEKNMKEVIALFRQRANEKGLSIDLEIDDSVPSVLVGDTVRIKQIFMNLISNAIKFTSTGSVKVILKAEEKEDKEIILYSSVKDTGIGIDKESIEKLFKAFSQADVSTTRKHGGTGLGLAISRNLTGIMGGYIGVDSEPGKGSDFYFTLRLKKGHRKQLEQKEQAVDDHEIIKYNFKILLVEDNAINQKVSTMLIKQLDQKVDLAENGRVAVDKVKEKAYDLIFMDIHMPLMDGYESTQKIREVEKAKGRKPSYIAAVTANAVAEDKEKCFSVGMDDYISKPFKKENLRVIFQKLMK